MKFLPLLKTCIKALVRNPMRAALTILGIIIGIAAVIAMVEIGQGSTLQIKSTIASMGADTLNIRPGAISKSGVNTGAGGRASLTNADCEAIMKDCPMVLRATPVVRASGQVIYGNKNWSPETVEGGSVEYLKIKSWYDMERGQPFSDEDVEQARRVCVIGQTVAKELFGDEDPLGKDIRIKNVMFKVIGILKKKGANMMGRDQDDSIILPWTSIRYRLQGLGGGSASASSGNPPLPSTGRTSIPLLPWLTIRRRRTSRTPTPRIRAASTTLTSSWPRLRTRNALPKPSTRSRKSSAPSTA